jgi:hypothetical protein
LPQPRSVARFLQTIQQLWRKVGVMDGCLERALIGLLREPVGEKTNNLRGHVGQANGRKLSWTWNGHATIIRLHDRPPAFRLFDDMNIMDENAGTEVLVSGGRRKCCAT